MQELTLSNASLQQQWTSARHQEEVCKSELQSLRENHLQEVAALRQLAEESRKECEALQQQIGKERERERELQLQVEKLKVC